MYIYDEIFEEVFYSSKLFDYYYKDSLFSGEENACIGVFDIETTGLDPRNGQAIMGALLTRVDGGLRVRQFFTEDDGEEEELLIFYKKALDEMDVLVSYNGNGFDFPYLKYRLKRHHLDASFSGIFSLDMFTVLNKFSNFREIIPNLRQKTVEEYLGLRDSRDDVIDGGQSVELFFRYLNDRSEELRDIMLLHNRDDVLQLSRILWAFDKLDIHKIGGSLGFPVKLGERKVNVIGIKAKTKRLEIKGRYAGISGRYHIFRDDCTVKMEPENEMSLIDEGGDTGKIEISIPLRYEDKTSFIVRDDLEFEGGERGNGGAGKDGGKYFIFKKDGEADHRSINFFVKDLVRDILGKI